MELGNAVPDQPIFFLKSPNSIIHDGESIRLLIGEGEVHQREGEIAVVLDSLSNATPSKSVTRSPGIRC